jgi:hypothetical protein
MSSFLKESTAAENPEKKSKSDNSASNKDTDIQMETNNQQQEDSSSTAHPGSKYQFKKEWGVKWPFIYKIENPESKRGLYCQICQEARKGGVWDDEPYRSVREAKIVKHVESAKHLESVKLTYGKKELSFVLWQNLMMRRNLTLGLRSFNVFIGFAKRRLPTSNLVHSRSFVTQWGQTLELHFPNQTLPTLRTCLSRKLFK